MLRFQTFFLLALAGLLVSCSSSKIVSSWGTDAYSPQHQKIMVFAILKAEDSSLKKRMEHHLIGDLERLGYKAYAASEVYSGEQLMGLNTTQVYQKLQLDTVDAVMTIVLLNKEKEQVYVGQKPNQGGHNNDFGKYYDEIKNRAANTGYYTSVTNYYWESKLYDLKVKELVYMSRTESFTPASLESLSHEYGKKIVSNMEKKGVLEQIRTL